MKQVDQHPSRCSRPTPNLLVTPPLRSLARRTSTELPPARCRLLRLGQYCSVRGPRSAVGVTVRGRGRQHRRGARWPSEHRQQRHSVARRREEAPSTALAKARRRAEQSRALVEQHRKAPAARREATNQHRKRRSVSRSDMTNSETTEKRYRSPRTGHQHSQEPPRAAIERSASLNAQ